MHVFTRNCARKKTTYSNQLRILICLEQYCQQMRLLVENEIPHCWRPFITVITILLFIEHPIVENKWSWRTRVTVLQLMRSTTVRCTKRVQKNCTTQGRRDRRSTGDTCPPPNFFKVPKVPFFVMKSAPFVQGNVAVNTKLISKVPFLFGNFDVFKINLVKNVQFLYGMSMVWRENFSPPPARRKHFRENFLGALFNIQKCPCKPVPPYFLMLPTPLVPQMQALGSL